MAFEGQDYGNDAYGTGQDDVKILYIVTALILSTLGLLQSFEINISQNVTLYGVSKECILRSRIAGNF